MLTLFGALFSAGNAAAQLLQTQWLEDPSGQMTLAQVQNSPQAFQAYTGVLTKGYTASSYWLKLRIGATPEDNLVLRIRPAYLDHIELHDPLARPSSGLGAAEGAQVPVRLAGDRYPKEVSGYLSLNQGFVIPGASEARDVFLRVQSTNTMLVYVEVISPLQAKQVDHRQELIYSLYLGLLVAFMVWALQHWLARREVLVAAFLVKQMVVVAHAAALLGYLPLLVGAALAPAEIDRITSFLVIAYVACSTVFWLMFLREYKPPRWLFRCFVVLVLSYLPIVLMFASGQVRQALELNMTFAAVESIGAILLSITARAWKDPLAIAQLPPWVLISFNLAFVLVTYATALPNLGVANAAQWTLYSPMFAGFITSLLMAVLLSLRARNLEKQRHKAILEAHLQQQQAQTERLQREEQAHFLSMLTHELKTPLSVAHISLDDSDLAGPQRTRIDRALANINSIIDRCAITDQMEHHKLTPALQPCSLGGLIEECVQGCSDPARVKVLEGHEAVAYTDSGLLAICLSNLIDNALKYSRPNSAIEVMLQPSTSQHGTGTPGWEITVCNSIGTAGIPDPERLFTKYYRSPGALSKSGSGLGLYLTRSVAELLGARLACRTTPHQVEFCLWIPA
ncbi:sensor histidine kinase [Acidovorax temperans]|uniref:sensor histidine kinase n=1 Tax=Acidovorax temperans TaxID=80878 RepID=UPI001427AC20|nr:sensor histidine kinase [Acidovorax temperans]